MAQRIAPSQMNLNIYRLRIKSSEKGHELLKRKREVLKIKIRGIMTQLIETKKNMGKAANDAYLSYAMAQYAADDFQANVRGCVRKASLRVDVDAVNITGVQLLILSLRQFEDPDGCLSEIGISKGGYQIQRTREKFLALAEILVKVASLQTSYLALNEMIKITNRRVNALEHVVIPRFRKITNYIEAEIEESEKEELFRIKKVLKNKRKIASQEETETEETAGDAEERTGDTETESDKSLEENEEEILTEGYDEENVIIYK